MRTLMIRGESERRVRTMVTPHVTPLGMLPSAHPETLLVAKLQLVAGTAVAAQTRTTAGLYLLGPRPGRPTLAA